MLARQIKLSLSRWMVAVAAIVLTGTGCGVGDVGGGGGGGNVDATPPVDCDRFTEAASVTLGGGADQTGFVALTDGADMAVVLGPQGLYMVTPSIRVTELHPGTGGSLGKPNDPMVVVDIMLAAAQIGGSAQERIGMKQTASGAELLGIFSPFTGAREEYDGELVTLRVTVTDACSRVASDELQVVARP